MATNAKPREWAPLVIRLMVGLVFLPEGLKKFLFPEQWGAGRFTRIGIPSPELMAHFVGAVEMTCAVLVLVGLWTRLAALPLVAVMLVALSTTKIPLLWRATASSARVGFWSMQAESRTDFAMLMGLVFLVVAGAGTLSVDARLRSGHSRPVV
ncbi:MAG TPA: DoxX family protein [Anaeromyxobacteraceae bacterium]|nr:DoxX family protein [Anaeromyxobacteraceae bacterium]